MEAHWRILNEALTVTAQNTVPNERRRGRRRMMTEEILEKMEERRKYKTVNKERYRQLDTEIKRECSMMKERWLNENVYKRNNWKGEIQERCII